MENMNLPVQKDGTVPRFPRIAEREAGNRTAKPEAEARAAIREKLPVLMTIRADQDVDSPDPDHTELTTEATMELTTEGLALTYLESELTGMQGTVTTLEVAGPRVILRRTGTVSSQMVFEEGRQHTSLYETPFGELSIDIQTSYLRHSLSELGGLMEIRYSISVEHASTGRNRFRVAVKRRKQSGSESRNAGYIP